MNSNLNSVQYQEILTVSSQYMKVEEETTEKDTRMKMLKWTIEVNTVSGDLRIRN